jgi:RND superfamily putative drug exporter
MAFKVPESKKHLPSNRFEFETGEENEDGSPVTLSIPLLAFLPVDAAAAFEQGMEIRGILLACESEEARIFVGSLDTDQFRAFMQEWNRLSVEHQKISAGESSASSVS